MRSAMRAPAQTVKLLSLLLVIGPLACGKRDVAPSADPARTGPAHASANGSASPSASAPGSLASAVPSVPPADDVPEMAFKPLGEAKASQSLYPITGALMVAEERRIGRIVPETETIEWVGKIPTGNPALGGTYIREIVGKWPEPVDVLYQNLQGRAAEPTYLPLLPKAPGLVTGQGGSLASIAGVATVNGSTLVAYHEMASGYVLRTMRGKALPRKSQTVDQAGCKPDEVTKIEGFPVEPAVRPYAVGATEAGTLITVGTYCDKRGYASEIWDKDGKSRIVPLPDGRKDMGYPSRFLGAGGDELYLFSGGRNPILHYEGGAWKMLPKRAALAHDAFLSPDKKLYLVDDDGIHRLDDGAWKPVARFGWSAFWPIAFDGKTYWTDHAGKVGKLTPVPAGERLELGEGCNTPFVYISDVDSRNDDKFTFPTTRKALSTFAGIEELGLVQFTAGVRRLGLTVKSREQGEAVIAHLAKEMKQEKPRLVCFAPKEARVIPWRAK